MDIELENLGQLLFRGGVPGTWKDDPVFSNYLLHLSSCGIERLGRESALLKEESSVILEQTQDLAYSNYKTFIHTAECSRAIYKDFNQLEDHLENASSLLPELKTSAMLFLQQTQNLANSRHLASLTLAKHTQLLEILELPQLMDTCVRNSYYDEAFDIISHVKRLERKHSDIPIIVSIVGEVQAGANLMLVHLISQLRAPLSLPQCLKVVGFLRRLEAFTEPELRLKFLHARNTWFTSVIKAIPKDDAFPYIMKLIEAFRISLFDIVTQYRSVFSYDDPRASLSVPDVNEQGIWYSWLFHKVQQFISILENTLEKGVGCNLDTVLSQCMFFGQSFTRIGADFRSLLTPIFKKAVVLQCEKDIRAANFKFDETLSCFSFMDYQPLSDKAHFFMEAQDQTRPSLSLMEFTPIANYINGLITAFNNLRQCCPLGVLKDVLILLTQSVSKVISALLELHKMESSGFTTKEQLSFERMCTIIVKDAIPHINSCLRLLFPLSYMSQVIGASQLTLKKEKFGLINIENVVAPIEHLLPKHENFEYDNKEMMFHVSLSPASNSASSAVLESTDEQVIVTETTPCSKRQSLIVVVDELEKADAVKSNYANFEEVLLDLEDPPNVEESCHESRGSRMFYLSHELETDSTNSLYVDQKQVNVISEGENCDLDTMPVDQEECYQET